MEYYCGKFYNSVPGLNVRELCTEVDLPVGGHRSAEGLHAGPSVGPEWSQKGFNTSLSI